MTWIIDAKRYAQLPICHGECISNAKRICRELNRELCNIAKICEIF